MAATYAQGLILLLVSACMWAIGTGNMNWRNGFNYNSWAHKHRPSSYTETSKIIVGGSQNWTFGFDYHDWGLQNSPFYVKDTLVFRYDAPSEKNTHPHNVLLLPSKSSYINCNLSGALLVANETQGVGDGFEFVLNKSRPYYFACGIGNGFHCSNGKMKFVVFALPRWHY